MSLTKVRIVIALVLALGFLDGSSLAAADQPAKSTPLENFWADLASADDVTATRAILAMSKKPAESLAYLKENLPVVTADPKRVAKLIADLDSNQFPVRQKAAEELEYLGKFIKDDLEKALAAAAGIETKQRLQQLVDKLPKKVEEPKPAQAQRGGANVAVIVVNGQQRILVNGVPVDGAGKPPAAAVGPSMYWVRAVRAIALLEHLGTPEAKQLLEQLAGGEAEALPTETAKAALGRLNKR